MKPKARPYLDNEALALDNNSGERAMKPVAIVRKNWKFASSEGGEKALDITFNLIETARVYNLDAGVLERIADHKINGFNELMS